jgi:hypothetical protein
MPNLQGSNVTEKVKSFFIEKFSKLSADTLGWVAILFLHGATLPGLIAMMTGLTDNPPPVDVILMVWSGLILLFTRAAIQKDMLNLITIGLGFMLQAVMMILIFFK